MKALFFLKNLDSETCKPKIIRNLNRIMDIRIIDIDVSNGILHFLYNVRRGFEQVKKELTRIGYPMQSCENESHGNYNRSSNTIRTTGQSYFSMHQ